MADHFLEVSLPPSVEHFLLQICELHDQPLPDAEVRWALASVGEVAALDALHKISCSSPVRNLSGFILHMVRKDSCASPQNKMVRVSPHQSPSSCCRVSQLQSPSTCSVSLHQSLSTFSLSSGQGLGTAENASFQPPTPEKSGSFSSSVSDRARISQFVALGELEFRKAFLLLSYIGGESLERVTTAEQIQSLSQLAMEKFEDEVWKIFGKKYITNEERRMYVDWDRRKTHIYHCYVALDGSYRFKGPFLNNTKTHLQRVLGDDNVLMVKFAEDKSDTHLPNHTGGSFYAYNKIARDGILLGLRRYRFFVFKDGGKEEKKKNPTTSAVKCYFVRMESDAYVDKIEPYKLSNRTVFEARSLFMHAHMVSSIASYMARFSLILSKTIKLKIDLSTVKVQRIGDIPCKDIYGNVIYRDGKPLIHTDGTGFISEDLALECPMNVFKGQAKHDADLKRIPAFEGFQNKTLPLTLPGLELREPPLLIQFRLFYNGLAVKGTFLVNKQLPPRTIQIRDSMIKVEIDPDLVNFETENSLELVGTSNPPKRTFLSRNLIALLNYGGVPREYFMTILVDALKDVQGVFSSKRAALRVSINNGEMDDFLVARMILAGIPLDESYLQYRLSVLLKEEKKSLKSGRLHMPECYYLMGTVDPTCTLESGEVCVILENGQINGKVLVYRNPGLHFGDIHVLTAKYVEELVPVVGNAKYAIFFSSKGPRSVADEIAGGDFDGDMYWVSRNSQLLEYFRPCEPWRPSPSTEVVTNRKPKEFSVEELENELFKLFLSTRFQPSYAKSVAADNWLALMDQFLMLGEERKEERNRIRAKILQLINIYYDALDAPKKGGKKIEVPKHLKAGTLPHFMERGKNSYVSTSILGQIFDTVNMYQEEVPNIEVQKLPCFEEEVPEYIFMKWKFLYELYRKDMVDAMQLDPDAKNIAAEATIKKYKEILYGAEELEGSPRSNDDVYQEALAIYQVTYDHAMSHSVRNCVFAWKVAGSALFKLYAIKHSERSFLCLPSVMREIFS
ncbi:putative RNA-dependent RNA polymerase 5 isoform X2 [Cucumis melo var. makuwa]|uniref:RNA-dependent RNA polymerase n=1 Tax=Cucumis melo var. makuwa TaxID=1194695 RepID=A0A5D3CF42_CUCMM|nr:putative RNA-dependent RNA polymerase 5 isoform X2 [Cucumis melo var. makuwa]